MKRYPSRFEGSETAPARCIELLDQVSPAGGVVLDLGCGRGPLAEPVKERGFQYVGVDIDRDALAEVAGRGFETHHLDLGAEKAELAAGLRQILSGRELSAMLTVDLVEHLVAPDELLRALRGLSEDASLIVSIPNITHLNVGAKLLLGRWDPTTCGLLDDTHIRYFSEGLLSRLLSSTGWHQVAAADAVDPDSFDQRFPLDAPTLRPGTPARALLHRLRSASEPHAGTYQFVRRFVPGDARPESRFRWTVDTGLDSGRAFASILVRASSGGDAPLEQMRADLAAQTVKEFETVEVPSGVDGWNTGIEEAAGRYLLFMDGFTRVSPLWIEAFWDIPDPDSGRVMMADAVAAPSGRLADGGADEVIAGGTPIQTNSLDLLALERPGPTVLSAYAVPADAVRAAGLRFEAQHGDAAAAVFLSRVAELSGLLPVAGVTVAVADTATNASDAALASVAESLDGVPMILPPGSATRILDMRQAITRSVRWRAKDRLRRFKRRLERRRASG